jgi:RHS repeat-associated protein
MNIPTSTLTQQLLWSEAGGLPFVLSDQTYDYVYGPTYTPVEQINRSTGVVTFMAYTATDSTWVVTNSAGSIVGFYGYDAFGTPEFGTATTPFGFAGQYLDSVSILADLRARFYEAATGIFVTRDADFSQSNQAYLYGNDDPINVSDPSGLLAGQIALIFIGIVVLATGIGLTIGIGALLIETEVGLSAGEGTAALEGLELLTHVPFILAPGVASGVFGGISIAWGIYSLIDQPGANEKLRCR